MTTIFTEDFIAAFRAEMAGPSQHDTKTLEMRGAQSIPDPKSGASGRFFVTPHAVNRYRERLRQTVSYRVALRELILITSAGKYMGPTYDGRGELWRGPRIGPKMRQDRRSRLRFVVCHGERGEKPQVVTVLAARERK